MSSLVGRLNAALGDRYEVESELGRGGMALVFLAREERNKRKVAIKVLRPELAVALGPERFLREIEVAASLTHPNILPLHDSGEANGLLYYVMPYVEGESLAARLTRETQLPIPDALRITGEVARALQYAHEHGIVHRDIKPDNILLVGDDALVADFGIAQVAKSISAEQLTSTGLALGTPHYMSPEQAAAETVDGRADIYSLGCVLYEMLAGQPPFGGKTAQAVIARHAAGPVPSLQTVRTTVTPATTTALECAMAKVPADRFATAAEFVEALEVRASEPARSPRKRTAWLPSRAWRYVAAGVAVAVIAIGLLSQLSRSTESGVTELDPNLIAVAPFRVGGTVDPSLGDLSSGIPELLYVRLNGEGGPRAVYPGTATSVWSRVGSGDELSQEEALSGARLLGSGRLLLGQVFGTADEIALSASLVDVATETVLARAENVRGTADSLLSLVDRLSIELLTRAGGEPRQRLSRLLTTDLDAVRTYLAGQAAYQAGRYRDANDYFAEAIDIDTTFALAGLGLAISDYYVGSGSAGRGLRIACAFRDRLSKRDQVFFNAKAGPNYPNPNTDADHLAARIAAAAAMPDRQEVQFNLGDLLVHWGPGVGIRLASEQAAAAFRGTLRVNSTHAPALGHLFELAVVAGDTAEARRLGSAYVADTSRDFLSYYRWQLAQAVEDTVFLATFHDYLPRTDRGSLERILTSAQFDDVRMEHVRLAAETLARTAESQSQLRSAYQQLQYLALNRARPQEGSNARKLARDIRAGRIDILADVFAARYWDGDIATAARAVAQRLHVDQDNPPGLGDPAATLYIDICAVNLWRAGQDDFASVPRAVNRLRAFEPQIPSFNTTLLSLCAAVLDAELAVSLDLPRSGQALEYLDSLARTGPPSSQWILAAINLTSAGLFARRGEFGRALDAIGRRPYASYLGNVGLSTFLREEGRIAAEVGDRERAIRAYNLYLNFRTDPEPELVPEVSQVRRELARLVGERATSGN